MKFYVFWFIAALLLSSGSAHAQFVHGNTDHYKDWRSPIFDGVKQVYIHVHYASEISSDELRRLPPALHRESIEAMLVQLYQDRFSSKGCAKYLDGTRRYSCEDQSVILVPDQDAGKPEYRTARQRPGTLNVEFQLLVQTSTIDGAELNPHLAVINVIQDRPDVAIPIGMKTAIPTAIPTTLPDSAIARWLNNYITNRLH